MGKILNYYLMPHPPIAVPEIGKGEEAKIQDTLNSCMEVGKEISRLKPDTIIVVTPHGPVFRDGMAMFKGSALRGSLTVEVKYNTELNEELTGSIIKKSEEYNVPVIGLDRAAARRYGIEYELDHGAMVPLYFVNKSYSSYKLVHITYGMLSKIQLYKFGMAVKEAVEESDFNAVFIASGDLSHRLKEDGPYGFNENGPVFDKNLLELLSETDVRGIFSMDKKLISEAGECGLRSVYTLLGAMDKIKAKAHVLSYEGTFGVGYGVAGFSPEGENESLLPELKKLSSGNYKDRSRAEDPYIELARESLLHYLQEGDYMKLPEALPEELINEQRGVFVSIKKNGELRGCIGTTGPTTGSVAQEIIRNAVEAGEYDPRFEPVTEDEWEGLDFSVDVLMPSVKADKSELDPEKYGVIVKNGGRAGLLLPDLEGVDTVDEQLDIALRKAGIDPEEKYIIEKFEVIRHGAK